VIPAVLLVAVAAGALTMAVLAVVQPTLPTRLPPVLVWVAATGGAVALALADTAPTGWEPLDLVLRAAFGASVPLAAARAGTVPTCWLLVVSVATLFIAVDAPGALIAGVAAGAFWALTAAGVTTPPAAAVAAAAGLAPMAFAEWPVATGASAAAVALATVPVLLVGLARVQRPLRGRIVLGLSVIAVFLVLGAVAGLAAALSARTDIDRAVDFATSGIDQLGDDDDAARANLRDAAGAFRSAEEDLTTWWARPALAVPGVAQQARAVSTMASAGADLALTAAEASDDADVESIRPRNGRIDLDALAALEEPLDRSVRSLRSADTRLDDVESPLLLSPLADRLQTLRQEVDDALDSADLAAHVVDVVPGLLGADGPRRYFIAFQNPSEQRGNGGLIGNWAELTAVDGQLTLAKTGRIRDLADAAPPESTDPIQGEEEVLAVWGQRLANWTSINFSPDHPTVSRLITQMYPRSGGEEIDGVVAITPLALAGFLELTGPIQGVGFPEALTPDSAARILLHEQYLHFPRERNDEREDFMISVVEGLFDQLTSGELPGPRAISEELSPAVQGRHLQMWAATPEEQDLFERLGVDGSARRDDVDSFGVVTQNAGGNKIDWFLHRSLTYDVAWDPASGVVEGTLTATLRNDVPTSGMPWAVIGWGGDEGDGSRPVEGGENYMILTLLSTFPIEQLTVDGEEVPFERLEELGHHAVRLGVSVPSQSVRTLTASVRGVADAASGYMIDPVSQPAANVDQVTATVRVADGWTLQDVDGDTARDGAATHVTRENAAEAFRLALRAEREDQALSWLDRVRGAG
jgi:hypothetical protein